ncbi:MAG: beta-glucosidase [Actinomycetales bacterium]|nr:MAG: beta-glucosidase [Actinomycetales bacterium]
MEPFELSDLMIGTATAAIQIEGGDKNNNWYDYATLPGKIKDGSSPLRSTDHWNRWEEDTALMAELGLQTYRMGLEWSRIEPKPGEFDNAAIQHYRAEIQAILAADIVPLVTLHHFTNPSWFQGLGEWTAPESVDIWLRFVRKVVTELGDLVTDWVTINEPNVYATLCHLFKEGPPGRVSWQNLRLVLRHMAIAHVRAYRLIHELQQNPQVGFAHHARVFTPRNQNNPLQKIMSAVDEKLFQDVITDAALGGVWSPLLGRRPADISAGTYYDYLGLNYYSRSAVTGINDGTLPGRPINDLGWDIYPEGIVEVAKNLSERYPAPIWITENGTADNGNPVTGELEVFRPRFILEHLKEIADSGLDFKRYYHWCFVDNWEWSEGEIPRFGLVHNDYETQTRTVKPSGQMISEIIAQGGVSTELIEKYLGPEYPNYA